MEIIKNKNILKAIQKKYNLIFDDEFRYCVSKKINTTQKYYINKKEYQLHFVSGCFYPYLIKTNRKFATFKDIPNYYNYYFDKKHGEIYYLCKRLSDAEKNELLQKYYNIDFLIIEPLFAAELKKDGILLHFKKCYN